MVPWMINNCKKWFRLFLSSAAVVETAQAAAMHKHAFLQNIVLGAKGSEIEKVTADNFMDIFRFR